MEKREKSRFHHNHFFTIVKQLYFLLNRYITTENNNDYYYTWLEMQGREQNQHKTLLMWWCGGTGSGTLWLYK